MADSESPVINDKPKKRPVKVKGSKRSLLRDERLKDHTTRAPCNCKKLKCFEMSTEADRKRVIDHLNALKTKDEQDAFLCSFITVLPVERRRSRKDPTEAEFNQHSFKYHINVLKDGSYTKVNVCINGFISIFDVSESRVRRIRNSLSATGLPPKDMRGQHANRPHALSELDEDAIIQHIQSFNGRCSHYSFKKNKKLYLSEDLNISKMFAMFKEQHPDIKCSYDTYKEKFNTKFNISWISSQRHLLIL